MALILFIIFVVLIVYVWSFSGRISRLERILEKYGHDIPRNSSPSLPVSQAGAEERQLTADPQRDVQTANAHISSPLSSLTSPTSFLQTNLSEISGVKWLTIIGVLALVLGLGFFLKYAIDQNWITPVMRVLLGLIVGGLLVVLGEIWKNRYKSYAHALVGGGLAIIYFSIYAAFGFYGLITQQIAVLCLIVVSGVGVALSYRYGSKVLGILSIFGGYLAPLMVSTGEDKHSELFIYISLLNIATLCMLVKNFWLEPLYIMLVGTALNFAFWAGRFSSTENLLPSIAFLLINFVIVILSLGALTRKRTERGALTHEESKYLAVFHVFVASSLFVVTAVLLNWHYKEYLSLTHLMAGVIVFITYAVIDRLEDKQINYTLSFIGSVFLFSSICWYFSGFIRDAYLLTLAMLGVIIGMAQKRKELRFWGLAILVISYFIIISEYYGAHSVFFLNIKSGMQILAAALVLSTGYLYQFKGDAEEKPLGEFAKVYAAGIVWYAVSADIVFNFSALDSSFSSLLLSLWWIGYAVILGVLSGLRHNKILRKGSIALFALAIVKVFVYDVLALDLGYRIVSFISLGVILLATALYYQQHKDTIKKIWDGQ